jgi:hypothetical protein
MTALALLIATSVQYYPVGSEDDAGVVMHYTEYCTSASLLFVAVLILYIPNPQSTGPSSSASLASCCAT